MSYKIKITKVDTFPRRKQSYERVYDRETLETMIHEWSKATNKSIYQDAEGKPSAFAYVAYDTTEQKVVTVLEQTVEVIDLKKVICALNGIEK